MSELQNRYTGEFVADPLVVEHHTEPLMLEEVRLRSFLQIFQTDTNRYNLCINNLYSMHIDGTILPDAFYLMHDTNLRG